jgi:hypothetical protein
MHVDRLSGMVRRRELGNRQTMRPCSEGWTYDPATRTIRITGGGEISARVISPKPLGTPPLPRWEWPERAALRNRKGWRVRP